MIDPTMGWSQEDEEDALTAHDVEHYGPGGAGFDSYDYRSQRLMPGAKSQFPHRRGG